MKLPSLLRRESEPYRILARVQNDLERLFDQFNAVEPRMNGADFAPSCEVTEEKTNYLMKFEMPGVKKEDVKIEVDGNRLTVSAERKEEKKADGKNHYSEFSYGSYQRSWTLPAAIDDKKVDAKFENGVLSLTLPKTEASKVKQISVQ